MCFLGKLDKIFPKIFPKINFGKFGECEPRIDRFTVKINVSFFKKILSLYKSPSKVANLNTFVNCRLSDFKTSARIVDYRTVKLEQTDNYNFRNCRLLNRIS